MGKFDFVDIILSDIMARADTNDHVRWQNAIAEARIEVVRRVLNLSPVHRAEWQELVEKTVKEIIHGGDGGFSKVHYSIGRFIHEASASALYREILSLMSEKVRCLKPKTLTLIIMKISEYGADTEMSFLGVHSFNQNWLGVHMSKSGVALLRELAVTALVARLYDKYYRSEHLTVQNIPVA